jgi:lysophospholipase L1-like esterase
VPYITNQPRDMEDGRRQTVYNGVSTSTETEYRFRTSQEAIYFENRGSLAVTLKVPGTSYIVAAGDRLNVPQVVEGFTVQSNFTTPFMVTGWEKPGKDDTRSLLPASARSIGYKVGFCGDSITNGANSSNASVFSFRAIARKLLGYRVSSSSVNGGVPGDRSDQLLARLDGIIAQGVQMLSVMIGTNDAASVPLTTYQANIKAMKAKADAAGLPIMFCLVPPRGSSSVSDTTKKNINAYNIWLRFWTAQNGIPLADTFSALVDPATGLMDTDYDSGDGTHPNNTGHEKLGRVIADVMDGLLPKFPWPVTCVGGGLSANPLFTDNSAWFTQAGAAVTKTVVAPTEGDGLPAGNWLKFTINNSAGGSTVNSTQAMTITPGSFAVGDQILVCLYIDAPNGKIQFMLDTTTISVPYDSISICKKVPVMMKYTVPAGGTFRFAFNFQAAAGQTADFFIGAADMFNLTALGLEDIDV